MSPAFFLLDEFALFIPVGLILAIALAFLAGYFISSLKVKKTYPALAITSIAVILFLFIMWLFIRATGDF